MLYTTHVYLQCLVSIFAYVLAASSILFESAIFKLIAYPRCKVKEVKELLFRCHLRLIKTAQTDENPRHSQFLSPFLIIHSSDSFTSRSVANIQEIQTKIVDKLFC